MNIRAFKKRERRSMRKLIKMGVFTASDFVIADGTECLDAPTDLDTRHQERGFINDGVMRGVPIISGMVGHYEPELVESLPSALLDRYIFETETDWGAIWEREEAARIAAPSGQERSDG